MALLLDSCSGAYVDCDGQFLRGRRPLDCYYGSTLEFVVLQLAGILAVLFWVITIVLDLIFAVFRILTTLLIAWQLQIIFVVGLGATWVLWWLAPTLISFTATTAWPFINYIFVIVQALFNLFVTIYGLVEQFWNNLCPLVGMWWSILFGLAFTLLTETMKLLGGAAVIQLFQLILDVRQLLVSLVTTVLEAIMSVASPVLQLLTSVLGPIISFLMGYVTIFIQMIFFFVTKVWGLLAPVMALLLWAINTVQDLFGRMMLARALLEVKHPRIDEQDDIDDVQSSFVHVLADNAKQYATPRGLHRSLGSADEIQRFVHRHPPASFSTYWEASHPIWSGGGPPPPGIDTHMGSEERSAPSQRSLHEVVNYADNTTAVDDADQAMTWLVPPRLVERRGATYVNGKQKDAPAERSDAPPKHATPAANFRYTAEQLGATPLERFEVHEERLAEVVERFKQSAVHRAAQRYFDGLPDHQPPVFLHMRDNNMCSDGDVLCRRDKHPFQHIAESGTRDWAPEHMLQAPEHGSHAHQQRVVAAAVLAHSVRHSMRWLYEDPHSKMLHRKAWEHAKDAFTRLSGHETLERFVVDIHERFPSGLDVLHRVQPLGADSPLFEIVRATRSISTVMNWSQAHHDDTRPYFGDWLQKQRVHVIKQRNVHTDREQDVYYWEQQDEADFQNHNVPLSRQAQRRLLGTLPFFELLADTNCFTTVPRNPLCLPTLFPDNFRLQVPVPLAVPSWMKDFTETCEVYYYEPERYVPTNAASFWSWLFSNTVLGPERMINGLIFLQVVLGGLLLAPAFALEKFGLQYPYMSWLPNLLLILPGGDTPSAQLIVCTATHTYDFLYDAWLAYLFFVIVAPLFTILLAAYASFLALIATQKMRQAARLERARKLIDVGLLSERNAPPLGNLGAGLGAGSDDPIDQMPAELRDYLATLIEDAVDMFGPTSIELSPDDFDAWTRRHAFLLRPIGTTYEYFRRFSNIRRRAADEAANYTLPN